MIKLFALGPFAPHLCVFFSQVQNICFFTRLTPAARQEAKSCSSKNETKPNKKEINRVLKLLKAVDSTVNEFVIKYIFHFVLQVLSLFSQFNRWNIFQTSAWLLPWRERVLQQKIAGKTLNCARKLSKNLMNVKSSSRIILSMLSWPNMFKIHFYQQLAKIPVPSQIGFKVTKT